MKKKFIFCFGALAILLLYYSSFALKEPSIKNEELITSLPKNGKRVINSFNIKKRRDILELANNYIEKNRLSLGIREYHKLSPTLYRSPLGTSIKYSVYQDELPIIGFEFLLDFDDKNNLISLKKRYFPVEKVEFRVPLSDEQLEFIFNQNGLKKENSHVSYVLVPKGEELELAISFSGRLLKNNQKTNLLISVNSGKILFRTFPRKEF